MIIIITREESSRIIEKEARSKQASYFVRYKPKTYFYTYFWYFCHIIIRKRYDSTSVHRPHRVSPPPLSSRPSSLRSSSLTVIKNRIKLRRHSLTTLFFQEPRKLFLFRPCERKEREADVAFKEEEEDEDYEAKKNEV